MYKIMESHWLFNLDKGCKWCGTVSCRDVFNFAPNGIRHSTVDDIIDLLYSTFVLVLVCLPTLSLKFFKDICLFGCDFFIQEKNCVELLVFTQPQNSIETSYYWSSTTLLYCKLFTIIFRLSDLWVNNCLRSG